MRVFPDASTGRTRDWLLGLEVAPHESPSASVSVERNDDGEEQQWEADNLRDLAVVTFPCLRTASRAPSAAWWRLC